jgi:hypothetical protein
MDNSASDQGTVFVGQSLLGIKRQRMNNSANHSHDNNISNISNINKDEEEENHIQNIYDDDFTTDISATQQRFIDNLANDKNLELTLENSRMSTSSAETSMMGLSISGNGSSSSTKDSANPTLGGGPKSSKAESFYEKILKEHFCGTTQNSESTSSAEELFTTMGELAKEHMESLSHIAYDTN